MGKLADDFRKGEESAKIKSYGDGIFRAFILATATAAAWVSPFPIWGRVLVFIAIMFIVGIIQTRHLRS